MLLFAQLCDRNFGGMRSRRSPKVQHIKKEPRRAHFIDSEEFLTYEYLFCVPDTIVIGLDEIDAYRKMIGWNRTTKDSQEFAADINQVVNAFSIWDRRIGFKIGSRERIRQEILIVGQFFGFL